MKYHDLPEGMRAWKQRVGYTDPLCFAWESAEPGGHGTYVPHWRTVAEDGMPEETAPVLVDNGKTAWVSFLHPDGKWSGLQVANAKYDRWIPLSELRNLPGGEA